MKNKQMIAAFMSLVLVSSLVNPMTTKAEKMNEPNIENYEAGCGDMPLLEEYEIESIEDYADGYNEDELLLADGSGAEETLPASFSLVDSLPALRNQGGYGTCWAHSTMAAIEANAIRKGLATKNNVNLSEMAFAYFQNKQSVVDPLGNTEGDKNYRVDGFWFDGNNQVYSSRKIASWVGASDESKAPYSSMPQLYYKTGSTSEIESYDESVTVADEIAYDDVYHVQGYKLYNFTDRDTIKSVIKSGDLITCSYHHDSKYYNSVHNAFYTKEQTGSNHSVAIVGWDDNFSKEYFADSTYGQTPEHDGAWLIRNSWVSPNESYYDEYMYSQWGYFWMSYEDTSLQRAMSYQIESADNYDNNYQYDGVSSYTTISNNNKMKIANVYTAKACDKGEILRAVSFISRNTNVEYTIDIYLNPNEKNPESGTKITDATTTGMTDAEGYYTVPLNKNVELSKGERYAIVITLEKQGDKLKTDVEYNFNKADKPSWYAAEVGIKSGQSYIYYPSSGSWVDISKENSIYGNLTIKGFTDDSSTLISHPYKVTYELNGGVNATQNASEYGSNAAIELHNPSKVGYTFGGWYLDSVFEQPITNGAVMGVGDITLYAKWTVNSYSVQFDGNGSTSGTTATMSCVYDQSYNLNKNQYEKTDYTFAGWNTVADGKGTAYKDKEEIKNLTAEDKKVIKLYAQWTENDYDISYELDGGTASENNPKTYKVSDGTVTLVTPTKTGYTFGGWYTDATFKDEFTSESSLVSGGMTIYAKWTVNSYSVQFDGNGSTSGTTATLNCVYDQSYNLNKNQYEKTDYTFAGWNTVADGKGTAYKDKEEIKNLTAEDKKVIKLYAQWTENDYDISYELDGGTASENNPKTYKVSDGTVTLVTPTKTGYTFGGWYTDATFKDEFTSESSLVSGGMTIYAKWTANTYSVQFDGNGSTSGTTATMNCVYDQQMNLTTNGYKKTGYQFTGWNTKKDGSGVSYKDKASITNLALENGMVVKLYAQWKKLPVTYTVTYNLMGGINDAKNPITYKDCDNTIKLLNPTKKGYTFAGWYTDGKYTKKVNAITKNSSGNKVFYAKWTAITYKIKFNRNGGKGAMKTITARYDKKTKLSKNTFKRKGYTFVGWATKKKAKTAQFKNISSVKNLSTKNGSTITLYAVWKKNKK